MMPRVPSSRLSPAQVVDTVLGALADDDGVKGGGAAVVYAFASDRMRGLIGDQAAFSRALGNSANAPLLGHASARLEALDRDGDSARAAVVITAAGGSAVRYTIALKRQVRGDRRGCWLLSGIAREGAEL
jgi:hypothetical protein